MRKFRFIHRSGKQRSGNLAKALYVDTHGAATDGTCSSLTTMAEAEMYVGVVSQVGFTMRAELKHRWFCDTILLTQSLTQKQISCRTCTAGNIAGEAQQVVATLLTQPAEGFV